MSTVARARETFEDSGEVARKPAGACAGLRPADA
jgi:hypothetical protein